MKRKATKMSFSELEKELNIIRVNLLGKICGGTGSGTNSGFDNFYADLIKGDLTNIPAGTYDHSGFSDSSGNFTSWNDFDESTYNNTFNNGSGTTMYPDVTTTLAPDQEDPFKKYLASLSVQDGIQGLDIDSILKANQFMSQGNNGFNLGLGIGDAFEIHHQFSNSKVSGVAGTILSIESIANNLYSGNYGAAVYDAVGMKFGIETTVLNGVVQLYKSPMMQTDVGRAAYKDYINNINLYKKTRDDTYWERANDAYKTMERAAGFISHTEYPSEYPETAYPNSTTTPYPVPTTTPYVN